MPRFIFAIAFLLHVSAFSCNSISQDALPRSFTLSRDQIAALHRLSHSQAALTFTWDWKPNDPWEWHGQDQTEKGPSHGILYAFNGDSWHTTDEVLKALTAFPETEHVDLAYCFRFSDDGIAQLKDLKSLRTLVLYRNAARYAGHFPFPIKNPEKIKQLLTDRTIEHIADFPALEALHLIDNEFSERGLLQLGRMKSLRLLSLDDSQITESGLKELKAMLPNCTVNVAFGRAAVKDKLE